MLVFVYVIMFLSLLLNGFGIHCLRKQRGGNKKQRTLLVNLSIIEFTKISYDFVPLTLYHFNRPFYDYINTYLDIIEINLMSILFSSIILISFDRLACVLLSVRYNVYIKESLVKDIILSTWIIGFTPGLFMWAIFPKSEDAKVYFYKVFDVTIIITTIVIYATVINLLRKQKKRFPRLSNNNGNHRQIKSLKMFLVPALIVTCFTLFSAIPDFITMYYFNSITFHVSTCLWVLGFLADPLIYIFLNKRSRQVAMSSFGYFRRSICVDRRSTKLLTKRECLTVTFTRSPSVRQLEEANVLIERRSVQNNRELSNFCGRSSEVTRSVELRISTTFLHTVTVNEPGDEHYPSKL